MPGQSHIPRNALSLHLTQSLPTAPSVDLRRTNMWLFSLSFVLLLLRLIRLNHREWEKQVKVHVRGQAKI